GNVPAGGGADSKSWARVVASHRRSNPCVGSGRLPFSNTSTLRSGTTPSSALVRRRKNARGVRQDRFFSGALANLQQSCIAPRIDDNILLRADYAVRYRYRRKPNGEESIRLIFFLGGCKHEISAQEGRGSARLRVGRRRCHGGSNGSGL